MVTPDTASSSWQAAKGNVMVFSSSFFACVQLLPPQTQQNLFMGWDVMCFICSLGEKHTNSPYLFIPGALYYGMGADAAQASAGILTGTCFWLPVQTFKKSVSTAQLLGQDTMQPGA